jgi:hypothetical protein
MFLAAILSRLPYDCARIFRHDLLIEVGEILITYMPGPYERTRAFAIQGKILFNAHLIWDFI